ncbi:hypothetical protein [Micromonospora aurantiaca]|uniref:hypothetical protein n=1 Tax=Micromonospora TaxID=1873 RepID=UPI001E399176|nr:hypothetical protein [Micromonospora aurantiaca]UFN96770.1 hypothetical protein LF814_11825 [Micromonospora aurantiaca]
MPTFLVPIEGLTVLADWKVGPVAVRPAAEALSDVRQGRALGSVEWFDELGAGQGPSAFAGVDAADLDAAIDLVAQAVDVLRVLQHVRYFTSELTQFGIAGDVGRGLVPYIQIEGAQVGRGFSHRGNALGWTFSDPDDWGSSPVFQWAASAIGASSPGESQRRALVGIQLLSQALVEQRGTFKMVELVGALEAWLLPRQASGQTFRLARAVAFFGCGRHDNDLCGRSRDTCPYLQLNPAKDPERRKLKRLQIKGALPPWRCSEWHRVVDWYDDRSAVVHGSGPVISYKDASNSLYWVCRYLAEPILQWLADHPVDPVAALEAEIAALPPAPDWEAMLGGQI